MNARKLSDYRKKQAGTRSGGSTLRQTAVRGKLSILLAALLLIPGCAPLPAAVPSPSPSQTSTSAPTPTAPPASTAAPQLSASPTSAPTKDPLSLLPVPPRFENSDEGERVYFGDAYKQLPEADLVDEIIIPELIIIHTDGQTANLPRDWNTDSTYHGLGEWYSVHFAVSQYDILQMCQLEGGVEAAAPAPQLHDQGEWGLYNVHPH